MGFDLALGVILVFAGIYLLVSAIRGKGGVYENDNIRKGHEEKYRKTVRICCFVVSPFLIATFIFSFITYCIIWRVITEPSIVDMYQTLMLLSTITRWAGLIAIVVMIVLTTRLADKSIEDKPARAKGHDPAFDFEDEKTESSGDEEDNGEESDE